MKLTITLSRRVLALTGACASALGVAGAAAFTLGASPVGAAVTSSAVTRAAVSSSDDAFSFRLMPTAGIPACLAHARGRVTIVPGRQNDTMFVSIHGMPARAGFDLFVTQQPVKPTGISWYQTDIRADRYGDGFAVVRGIFSNETFSVSTTGSPIVFGATHQFHLGLWFDDPQVPFDLGCEPGQPAPVITPFNGDQHAGIQVLNTAQFPVEAGPLSHVQG